MNNQELEVKYRVTNLHNIKTLLESKGAELVQARTEEINLRFDTQGDDLASVFQVLRLRLDSQARLTFKGPASSQDGIRLRREIEFTVSDFDSAREFLEALGYQVRMVRHDWIEMMLA